MSLTPALSPDFAGRALLYRAAKPSSQPRPQATNLDLRLAVTALRRLPAPLTLLESTPTALLFESLGENRLSL